MFKKYDIVLDGELYLRRYFIFRSRWFNIFLHNIRLPDRGRDPHDHPWSFLGLVLKGGYTEDLYHVRWHNTLHLDYVLEREVVQRKVGQLAFRRATDVHHIASVKPGTWTLVFTGPRVREWAFWSRTVGRESESHRWSVRRSTFWRTYLDMWDKREID